MGSNSTIGEEVEQEWDSMFSKYAESYPELASEYERRMDGRLSPGWKTKLPVYSHTDTKAVATRNRSEEVLNVVAATLPELMGGSADLSSSNLTILKCSGDFQKNNHIGRYLRFGVREHGMAAICNGIFAHGGLRPFCATFLNFLGYAMGSVRVSSLSRFGVLYIMTHDSIGLGEDGPTHQPIEMLECCRATPNLLTIRPADGNETVGAYVIAMEKAGTPVVMSLTRQALPTVEGSSADKVSLGAYLIGDYGHAAKKPHLVLIGTGSELHLAVAVAKSLAAADDVHVRVVSMPCCELFDQQPLEYKLDLFPSGAPIMSIEAGGTKGWSQYAHAPFGIKDQFGLSAPAPALFKHFGFTEENLVTRSRQVIAFYKGREAPSLYEIPVFPIIAPLH
jgi:transketolase